MRPPGQSIQLPSSSDVLSTFQATKIRPDWAATAFRLELTPSSLPPLFRNPVAARSGPQITASKYLQGTEGTPSSSDYITSEVSLGQAGMTSSPGKRTGEGDEKAERAGAKATGRVSAGSATGGDGRLQRRVMMERKEPRLTRGRWWLRRRRAARVTLSSHSTSSRGQSPLPLWRTSHPVRCLERVMPSSVFRFL